MVPITVCCFLCRKSTVVLVVSFYCNYSLLPVANEYVCTAVGNLKPIHMYSKQLSSHDAELYCCLRYHQHKQQRKWLLLFCFFCYLLGLVVGLYWIKCIKWGCCYVILSTCICHYIAVTVRPNLEFLLHVDAVNWWLLQFLNSSVAVLYYAAV